MDDTTTASEGELRVEPPGRFRPMQGLGSLGRGLDRVCIWMGNLSGFVFLVLALFVTYDVIARKWGTYLQLPTTRVTDEISGYILALAATWGLAYTLRSDAHVRIDVLLPYLSVRWRSIADCFALILMGCFAGLVSWKVWALALDSFESGIRSSTYLLTPQWIPESILGIGFSLLTFTSIAMALSIVIDWFSGAVRASAGVPRQAALSPQVLAGEAQEKS